MLDIRQLSNTTKQVIHNIELNKKQGALKEQTKGQSIKRKAYVMWGLDWELISWGDISHKRNVTSSGMPFEIFLLSAIYTIRIFCLSTII